MSLLNWIKRSTRQNRVAKRTRQASRQYQPIETLEARQLLTGSIATPTVSSGWQTTSSITVPIGKTLQVPLTDTTTAGNPLTYSVTSSNPNITATVHTGNTYVDIKVTGAVSGDMIFQLYNDLTPNTVAYIESFIQSGFYNNIIFHRVISGFVAQAGDPGGTGSYNPFNFPDEFNAQALYDGNGQLGMARTSSHDTNSTQFFITQGPQRFLDLNYTIFGQLVSGFSTFNQVMAVHTDSSDKPTTAVTISSATVIQDTTDAVVSLTASSGTPANATSTITVTASDGTNTSPAGSFSVQAVTDTTIDPPFLNLNALQTNYTTPVNTTLTIPISVTDLQGNADTITAGVIDSTANATVSVTQLPGSNVIRVTPNPGYTGVVNVEIRVVRTGDTSSTPDGHDIVIGVGAQPTVVTSSSATITSGSNATISAATFTDADTSLNASGFSATINWGTGATQVAGAVVQNSNGSFSVTGSNTFASAGQYTGIVTVSSSTGAGFTTNITINVISPNTANYEKYVTQLYTDLLGRSVDTAGLTAWTAALNSGETYAQVATAITSSREYDGIVVDAFYFDLLGRHAETVGLTAWVDQMQTGLNAEVIRAGILGSDEYYNRTGPNNNNGTDATFITALYQTFLGRAPDAGGLAAWEGVLAGNPANRQTVAKGISNSDENRTVIITSFFETYLHRAPDAGGLAAWKNLLANGISQPAIITAFVTSPEYLGRLGITA